MHHASSLDFTIHANPDNFPDKLKFHHYIFYLSYNEPVKHTLEQPSDCSENNNKHSTSLATVLNTLAIMSFVHANTRNLKNVSGFYSSSLEDRAKASSFTSLTGL